MSRQHWIHTQVPAVPGLIKRRLEVLTEGMVAWHVVNQYHFTQWQDRDLQGPSIYDNCKILEYAPHYVLKIYTVSPWCKFVLDLTSVNVIFVWTLSPSPRTFSPYATWWGPTWTGAREPASFIATTALGGAESSSALWSWQWKLTQIQMRSTSVIQFLTWGPAGWRW